MHDERLDRRGRRFSVSLSSAADWDAHVAAILAFVRRMSAWVAEAQTRDISIEADTAVGPKDIEGQLYVSCSLPAPILRELSDHGVSITVTLYMGEQNEGSL
jgi:hypothetical protein